ncbi:MAG TPA: glycosyltransferase [Methylovirgula sp.]
MDFRLIVPILGALWWTIAVAIFVFASFCTLVQPWLQRRRATNGARPPVSAILPIKLDNPGFEEAQASIFRQHYPDYEVLFGVAETNSPAVEIVQKLKLTHPEVAARIMQSHCDLAVSPKLNALAAPLAAATHDFILIKDSNIIFDPETLAGYMQSFTAGVGLVVGVPVAERPEGLAGHIEAFLINGYARLLLSASVLNRGFGVGKAMLFKRSDLAHAGGFEAMAYTLAEDTAISRGLAAVGFETVFAHKTLRQIIGRRTLREIYDRQLRWSVIRRAHEPATFPVEPLASPLPAAIAAAIAAPLIGISAGSAFAFSLFAWFVCEILIAWLKGWEVSILSPLAFAGREILTLIVWLRAWTTDDVVWANGRFDVFNGVRGVQAAMDARAGREKV